MSPENNLKSIARRTGVSISTVSRVLNGKHEQYRISAKTVKRVMDEAKRIDYKPSILAQSLRTNKTYTIGLLIPSIDNPYFATIASEIVFEAKRYGYTVILLDTLEDEGNESECINTLLTRSIDGIILVPCGERPESLEKIDEQTPIVLIDRYFEDTSLSYICTDNYRGALDGVKLLIENGHKEILCIRGVPHSMPSKERVKGYIDALRESGFDTRSRITGNDYSITNGYLETKLAIGSPARPPAEQYHYARGDPGDRGIFAANPGRCFDPVVRQQPVSGFPASGRHPYLAADQRDQPARGEDPDGTVER